MGSWGSAAFENDVAEDWLDRLLESNDLLLAGETLEAVLDAEDRPAADPCCAAIAAAETIAASRGRWSSKTPDELREWLKENVLVADDELARKAIRAVARIRDQSELAELWKSDAAWRRGLHGLIRRLRSPAKRRGTVARGPELPPDVAEAVRQLRKHAADVLFEKGNIWCVGLDMINAQDSDVDWALKIPDLPYFTVPALSNVSTAAMCRLADCKSLQKLVLRNEHVTDEVLQAIATLPLLRELDVSGTPITDAGLLHLHALADLQELNADYTQVTGSGLVALQERFPDCDIRPIKLLRSAGGRIPRRTSKPFLAE